MNRRHFFYTTGFFIGSTQLPGAIVRAMHPINSDMYLNNLLAALPAEVIIQSLDIRNFKDHFYIICRSNEGAEGIAFCNDNQIPFFHLLEKRIFPHFIKQDARNIPALIDRCYKSNYKLSGLPFWNSIGHLELSLWDMMGKTAGKPVAQLIGKPLRSAIPVYLSSLRRDTTPEEEVAALQRRLEETGARAVKIKIGGRMSNNADAAPGRTGKLIELARKTLGDSVTLYADANGSYTSEYAITIGKMLEAQGFSFYEEPCPWEEFTATKAVADALTIAVAGGEQDTSMPHFEYMIKNRVLDIVQPDIVYNGGIYRNLQVARIAAENNMLITPHCPKNDMRSAFMLHFAASVSNIGPFMEYYMQKPPDKSWYAPIPTVKNGTISIPSGPGFGITYDEEVFQKSVSICGR